MGVGAVQVGDGLINPPQEALSGFAQAGHGLTLRHHQEVERHHAFSSSYNCQRQ